MLTNENSRSKKLLDKVYDHLESIDVTKLSMNDLTDYLEVVQKGQFLESFGSMPQYGFGYGGANWPVCAAGSTPTGSGEGTESSVE